MSEGRTKARGEDERELLSLAATVPFDDRYNQRDSLACA
jgi:ATP-dependent DNA helicase RecG